MRDFSIPLQTQEISLQQRADPYFKDIFEFPKAGVLPSNNKRARNAKQLAEDYVLVNQVLFKVIETKDSEKFRLVLAIPDKCVPYLFSMSHDSL